MASVTSRAPTPAEAIDALWRAGDLSYALLPHQEPVREAIARSTARRYVLNISRRWGKSMLLCLLAVEQCLQKAGSSVRYAAGTSDMVEEIIEPHMAMILDDAPSDLAPEFHATKVRWTFPNGSSIRVAGCDDRRKANRLRGRACDLAIIDEAGFIDDLDYVIDSVLMPQFLTTGGRMVVSSTPPETPAHPFRDIAEAAELAGAYTMRTIYDASHIGDATRAEFCEEAGGSTSTTWRREYLCEFVVDETLAVLPEFAPNESAIVVEHARPEFFVPTIVLDAGYHDHSFGGLGYHDFRSGLDVIEDEYETDRTLARDIDRELTQRALALWGEKALTAKRYVDAPAQVTAELNGEPKRVGALWQGISKTHTDGPFLVAATNDLRQRCKSRSLRIHPRCKRLVAHARNAIWKTPGRDYERLKGYGHFDGVAMLTYFTRVVDRRTDPYPNPRREPDRFYVEAERKSERDSLRDLARGARHRV